MWTVFVECIILPVCNIDGVRPINVPFSHFGHTFSKPIITLIYHFCCPAGPDLVFKPTSSSATTICSASGKLLLIRQDEWHCSSVSRSLGYCTLGCTGRCNIGLFSQGNTESQQNQIEHGSCKLMTTHDLASGGECLGKILTCPAQAPSLLIRLQNLLPFNARRRGCFQCCASNWQVAITETT